MHIAHSLALLTLGAAVIGNVGPPQHATRRTAPAASATPSAVCVKLAADYDQASKTLASNTADGIADNSAIRASMREAQNGNVLTKARFTLDLMKSNGCPIPTEPPSDRPYLTSALRCRTDDIQANTAAMRGYEYRKPATCNQPGWVADKQ